MSGKIERYRAHAYPVPETMLAWQMTGAGFENVGERGAAVRVKTPRPRPHELLCRVDAVGLCFSDVKLILAGNNHPRIKGRDLKKNPTRGGHELSLTVAEVGEAERATYKVGERYIIQSDIYCKGRGMAFGYVFPGGMSEYTIIPEEALHGDEGSYLIPLREGGLSYAEAALVEPWACVEAAYRIRARTSPREGGRALVVGPAGRPPFEGLERSGEVKTLESPDPDAIAALARTGGAGERVEALFTDPSEQAGFDDIVLAGPAAASRPVVEAALGALRRGGILCLLGRGEFPHEVTVDVGRVHYQDIRIVAGDTIPLAYAANTRQDLLPGGAVHMSGAAGPMGQMHVQRAVEHDRPPRLVAVSDLADDRLAYTVGRVERLARSRGVEIVSLNPKRFPGPREFEEALVRTTGGRGFDDVVLCAPVGALVASAVRQAAEGCVVNIFAGVALGTTAVLDLDAIAKKRVRIVGSSGSRLADMQYVASRAESGHLATGVSAGAIGGCAQMLEGLIALKEGRFPGKIVIYPAVASFPLTAVGEIASRLPRVGALLGPGGVWTKQAEEAFLEETLPARA